MENEQAEAVADRLQRSGLRKMTISAIAFVTWQISYFALIKDHDEAVRNVDIVRTLAFIAWSLALLMLVATGGAGFRSAAIRRFIDDESNIMLRQIAYRNAFWAMMAAGFLSYAATLVVRLQPADVAHICVSTGVLAAVATHIYLERQRG